MLRSDDAIRESRKVPRPGDVVADKYEVERTIGSGGMGVVVAAKHIGLGERVALKFLVPRTGDSAVDEHTMARFFREAQLTARVKSDHVARVLDVGGHESGTPFMVMELLEGADLQHVSRERGPLPVMEAARYVLQACLGLAEAHAAGVVHRDLKPANLFLTQRPDGTPLVKVLDFGIGKLIAGVRGTFDHTLTTEADLLGSPLYMSPEQIKKPRDADARGDVWSMGAILYTLLAGKPPFTAENAGAILAQILADAPDPFSAVRPDVPPGLEAVVMRCLEKDPSRRFARAEDLARALTPFAISGAQAAPSVPVDVAPSVPVPIAASVPVTIAASMPVTPERVAKRRPLSLVVAAAALLGAGALVSVWIARRASADAAPPALSPPVLSMVASAEPTRDAAPSASATATAAAAQDAKAPATTEATAPLPTASAAPPARPKPKGVKRIDVLEDRL